jgi:hypothetical protein
MAARQQQLRRLGQIFHDVEAVGTLHRLGSADRGSFRVLTAPISADHRDVWVLPHPGCYGCCVSIR